MNDLVEHLARIPEEQRRYFLDLLGQHLYDMQEWSLLFALLDAEQYGQVKLADDPSTHSYAQDLDLGRQVAVREHWTLEEGLSFVPYLWRYTLLRCSLLTAADRYPLDAFRLLLLLNQTQKALGLAALLTDLNYQKQVLAQLAKDLIVQTGRNQEARQHLMTVSEMIRAITPDDAKTWALSELAVAFARAQQWEQARAIIETIDKDHEKAWTLSELAVALAYAQQWEQARVVISTIEARAEKAWALGEVAHLLTLMQQREQAATTWKEAEAVIRTIESDKGRSWAMTELAAAYARAQQWDEARAIIGTLENRDERTWALSELTVAYARAQQWDEARAIIGTLEEGTEKVWALSHMGASCVAAQQWEQAEAAWTEAEIMAAGFDKDKPDREKALSELAQALVKAQQWERAKAVSRLHGDAGFRAWVLGMQGLALAGAQQLEQAKVLWTEAEALLQVDINDEVGRLGGNGKAIAQMLQWNHARALSKWVEILVQAQQWERARDIAHSIKINRYKVEALSKLGAALAEEGQWEQAKGVWREAEALIRSIDSHDNFIAERKGTWNHRIEITQGYEWDQARALWKLGAALSEVDQQQQAELVWNEAETVAYSIIRVNERERVLDELAATYARAHRWERAERIYQSMGPTFEPWCAERQAAMAHYFQELVRAQQWDRAEAVHHILGEYSHLSSRSEREVKFCQAFARAKLWERAEAIAQNIEDEAKKVYALRSLSLALSQAQQWERAQEMWTRAEAVSQNIETTRRFLSADWREWEDFLAVLSVFIQAEQWERARLLSYTLKEGWLRARALRVLSEALAQAQQWEQARTVNHTIEDVEEKVHAQLELSMALARVGLQEQAKEEVKEVEEVIRAVKGESWGLLTLQKLGIALVFTEQRKRAEAVWAEVKAAIDTMEDRERSIRALTGLGMTFVKIGWREQAEMLWTEVLEASHATEDVWKRAQALRELGMALVQVQRHERAEAVWAEAEAATNAQKTDWNRTRALEELHKTLLQACQWERAESVSYMFEKSYERAEALEVLTEALFAAGEHAHLLHLVQHAWLQVANKEFAMQSFPLVIRLISLKSDIGAALYQGFVWVDTFLKYALP